MLARAWPLRRLHHHHTKTRRGRLHVLGIKLRRSAPGILGSSPLSITSFSHIKLLRLSRSKLGPRRGFDIVPLERVPLRRGPEVHRRPCRAIRATTRATAATTRLPKPMASSTTRRSSSSCSSPAADAKQRDHEADRDIQSPAGLQWLPPAAGGAVALLWLSPAVAAAAAIRLPPGIRALRQLINPRADLQ